MRRPIIAIALLLGCASAGALERYLIDTEGMHAAIEFRIQHLGYSWLSGRFNTFSGWFEFDPALVGSKVEVLIDTRSIDSNHAERDERHFGEHHARRGDPTLPRAPGPHPPGARAHTRDHPDVDLQE